MKTSVIVLLILVALSSCQFSKSVKKDLISGLFTTGDGLSCDNVYISVDDGKVDRSTFVYGEVFVLNFSGIEGFRKESEKVFPGMKLVIVSNTGDTILKANDLYRDYTDGINLSPLHLMSDITIASPMKSKNEYTLYVKIWDKKGTGNFTAKFVFKVISNENIIAETKNVTYSEIYLFSKERNKVIPGNKIKYNEDNYVIVERLQGFKAENGMVFPGLSIKGTDKEGKPVLDFNDLFADYTQSGLAESDFVARVASHFKLTGSEFKNPLHCEIIIWDKKSEARIKLTSDLFIE